jgi:innexin
VAGRFTANMLGMFAPLQKLLKLEKVAIDNIVFRLHYKVTVFLFILFSLLVTAKQYFGDPIECHVDNNNPVPPKVVNLYCWVMGTFTVPSQLLLHNNRPLYPGVLPHHHLSNQETASHKYYQWVCFIIFGQAALFYLPRHIWKTLEGGKVKFCTADCPKTPPLDKEEEEKRLDRLYRVFKKHEGRNTLYAAQFFMCELVNLLNVVGNILLVNTFLSNKFINYGRLVLEAYMSPAEWHDPMSDIFPKAAKCVFLKYGTGGDVINHDALCILSLNIINEKVYLVMWFWLMFLVPVTTLNIFYRIVVIGVPGARSYVLWRGSRSGKWNDVAHVATCMPIGDWFLLRQISKNVDEHSFSMLIARLAEDKDTRRASFHPRASIFSKIRLFDSKTTRPSRTWEWMSQRSLKGEANGLKAGAWDLEAGCPASSNQQKTTEDGKEATTSKTEVNGIVEAKVAEDKTE